MGTEKRSVRRAAGLATVLVLWAGCVSPPVSNVESDETVVNPGIQDVPSETVVDLDLLSSRETITVKPRPIRFVYELPPYSSDSRYALRVNVSDNERNLSYLEAGAAIDAIPFFGPGTGLAGPLEGGYPYVFVDDYAHHYVIYALDDEGPKRAELISEANGLLRLSWPIAGYVASREHIDFAAGAPEALYFAVIRDFNLNGTIDEGEFIRLTIRFER